MRARHTRGFALVIVVICSVAMVAIAVAVAFTTGANRIVSVKGSSIERAETIAVAGLERAVAYAERVAELERDFDRLLDPTADRSCEAPVDASTAGLPRFFDAGAIDVAVDGRQYRAVPFNEGAYLVRFDDDADDAAANPRWAAFTGNRPQNDCLEGPAYTGRNNPLRDRNRAVWVSVIGIYPGIDPARAPHRVALRRYHVSTARLPSPALVVGGSVDAQAGLSFCSSVGYIGVGGDLSVGASSPVCGTPMAGGTVSSNFTQSACGGEERCATFGAPAPGTALDPTLVDTLAPSTTTREYQPPKASCSLFAVDHAAGFGGLFFWDDRAACTTMPASVPTPTAANVVDPGGCLRPLFLTSNVGDEAINVMGWTSVSTDGWKPGTIETRTLAAAVTHGSLTFPAAYQATQPDWSTCMVEWKGTGPRSCGSCNGTHIVARVDGARDVFDASIPDAVPAVTVRRADLVIPDHYISPVAPATDSDTGWPLLTFVVSGNASVTSSNAVLGFGVAERAPSFVVGGSLTMTGSDRLTTAGSVLVRGSVSLAGNPRLRVFGALVARGALSASGSAAIEQNYQFDVFELDNDPLLAAPTTSRALR